MGNECNNDTFYMDIKIIGSNLGKLYDNIYNSDYLKNIRKFWNIAPRDETYNNLEKINIYFNELNQIKEDETKKYKNIRKCLILKVNNLLSEEVNIIIQKMDELIQTYFMPLVLILTTEQIIEKKLNIDTEEYIYIDPRLIFIENYTENIKIFDETISLILVRFCSINNELGDKFYLTKNGQIEYNLIKDVFPFYLNIACLGRFGQGKSTGVNVIIQDYKAKESHKGSSQTKKLTFYQIDKKPIRVLDIPGFESEETVKHSIAKLKECREKNQLKDKIHIILYFFNYYGERTFMELEYPILEEISKNENSKLIYVITKSKPNMNIRRKKIFYDKINSGFQGITKNKPLQKKYNFFKADENNVVFVNFHKDEDTGEPFGKKELFKKIHDFFLESKSYKDSLVNYSPDNLIKTIEEKKSDARNKLLYYKIIGGASGAIPFVDIGIQKFYINKNAIKELENIFEIEFASIDEENKKEEENKTNEKKESIFNKPDIDKNNLEKVKGEDLNEDYSFKNVKFGCDILNIGEKAANNISKASYYSAKAIEYSDKAGSLAVNGFVAAEKIDKFVIYQTRANQFEALSHGFNFNFFGIGTILSIGIGAYCTHSFCENLINKFAEYYQKNADKITNSYKEALSYFMIP